MRGLQRLTLGIVGAISTGLCACESRTDVPRPLPSVADGDASGSEAGSARARPFDAGMRGDPTAYAPGTCTAVPTGMSCQTGAHGDAAGQHCTAFCDAARYEMICSGSPGQMPAPASSLACEIIPIPTPSNVLFYCCPYAEGHAGAPAESPSFAPR
jgi:hypothetical protein